MALISTLRTKMTKWVVGAIALSMGAFIVGSDLFGSGPRSVFGGSDREVGEIAGKAISVDEYNAVIQSRENNYILGGKTPMATRVYNELKRLRREGTLIRDENGGYALKAS